MTKFSIFLSTFICLNVTAISDELKVGIVDMTRVFGEYYKTKDVEKEIEKKREIARSEVNERDGELKDKMNELKALQKEITDPVSSREVRAAAQKKAQIVTEEAKAMRDEVLGFARKREMQLMEMSKRKREAILKEIQSVVKSHSTEVGYDLVFDKSSKSTRGISFLLYSKDASDFSAKMITRLNTKGSE
ncbi:MAG: OmpH family outer membrane protein [Verrucomicrobiota bacterium]|nr:OmpH family outer membrane protein [Verrucomicrobiota bacterium]